MAFPQARAHLVLRRRLNGWQIFFIAIGGVIGIGFFRGSSKSLAIAGPVGALIAVAVVGVVAIAVMEGICELIIRWPIPNAMVEFVRSFVDEDLGVAIGIMYWYTYCVTFSALIIVAGDLTAYWELSWVFKALIYAFAPLVILAINALPVYVFGWIELIGGIVKVCLVVGTIALMCCLNAGTGPGGHIGSIYFEDGVQNNPHVAANHFTAVCEAIPLATFAYIGVELLTTTAFEAKDPGELMLPARNIAWFSTVLYVVATGTFVANISWKDQNLPKLFQQALVTITTPPPADLAQFDYDYYPETHAAPLIALLRSGLGRRYLPGFLNGCFIYSAFSCANTALFVASRQLYGLTQSITVEHDSNILRRLLSWPGRVDARTRSPWPALTVSVFFLYWLPFIRIRPTNENEEFFLHDVQDALISVGSVSCVLMWFFQCIAFISFSHWRRVHTQNITGYENYEELYDRKFTGWFEGLQPGLAWLGAASTLAIVCFFNTASMWNGDRLSAKLTSTMISPGVVLVLWALKKLFRPKRQRRLFVRLGDPEDFITQLRRLDSLIYPVESDGDRHNSEEMLEVDFRPVVNRGNLTGSNASDTGDEHITSVRPTHRRGDLLPLGEHPILHYGTAEDPEEPVSPLPNGEYDGVATSERTNSDLGSTARLNPTSNAQSTHLQVPRASRINPMYEADSGEASVPLSSHRHADSLNGFSPPASGGSYASVSQNIHPYGPDSYATGYSGR